MAITGIWKNWTSTASCASTNAVYSPVWIAWCDATATADTACAEAPYFCNGAWQVWVEKAVETETQRAERERQEEVCRLQREAQLAELAAQVKQAEEKRKAAHARALILLLACLNEQQRQEYQEKRHFHVRAKSGRRYQIEEGRSGNLRLVDETGKTLKRFCVHPREPVPNPDTMLAQKLWLENDEEALIRIANLVENHVPLVPQAA